MFNLFVADDDIDFSTFLCTVAERAGWTVHHAANGRVLMEQLAGFEGPALLLIDINMPEVDGIEVIDQLVLLPNPLRVRFMTGGQDTSMVAANMIAKARNLSLGRSLFKPIPMAMLRDVLAEEAQNLPQA